MARIKLVLNERRLAYEGALKIHADNRAKTISARARHGRAHMRLQRQLKAVIADDKRAEREKVKMEKEETKRLEEKIRKDKRAAKRLETKANVEEALRMKQNKEARIRRHKEKLRMRSRLRRNRKAASEVRIAARRAGHNSRAQAQEATSSDVQ
jgi:hypothetical protein